MLITNQKCRIWCYKYADMKSQPVFDDVTLENCTVIHSKQEQIHTPVRADSSATQGRSTQRRATFRLQLIANTVANFGAKVEVTSLPNEFFRIVEIQPRFDAMGRLHHHQVDLEIF